MTFGEFILALFFSLTRQVVLTLERPFFIIYVVYSTFPASAESLAAFINFPTKLESRPTGRFYKV